MTDGSIAGVLADLARLRLDDHDRDSALTRITEVTLRALPATSVSLTLTRNDRPVTAASTGPPARQLDECQYRVRGGPCLHAMSAGETVVIGDTTTDGRWPEFSRVAGEHGIRSSVSTALDLGRSGSGSMNIYASSPQAFDGPAGELAAALAEYTAVAVANVERFAAGVESAEQAWQAIQSRAVIDQAKGVLVRERGCTPEEAFELLKGSSMRANRKVRDIAVSVVRGAQSGDAPEPGA